MYFYRSHILILDLNATEIMEAVYIPPLGQVVWACASPDPANIDPAEQQFFSGISALWSDDSGSEKLYSSYWSGLGTSDDFNNFAPYDYSAISTTTQVSSIPSSWHPPAQLDLGCLSSNHHYGNTATLCLVDVPSISTEDRDRYASTPRGRASSSCGSTTLSVPVKESIADDISSQASALIQSISKSQGSSRNDSASRMLNKTKEPYSKLIYRALMSTSQRAMTVQEIYQWFRENTDKGKDNSNGWQNSIRHNLSMNKVCYTVILTPITFVVS